MEGICMHFLISHPIKRIAVSILFNMMILTAALGKAVVTDVRIWSSENSTRVVFELSDEPDYETIELEDPYRYVIDFKDTKWNATINKKSLMNSQVASIRHAIKQKKDLRIVLEMDKEIAMNSFLLHPSDGEGHRLVVDLGDSVELFAANTKKEAKPSLTHVKNKENTRPFIVAIDAGHGGEDTGAVGRKKGTHEKEVVLHVAKKLKAMIDKEPHMKAFLVREGDYFIPLRRRMAIAREGGADLFISLHADSALNAQAKGASVYCISQRGASSEAAKWLADRENKADLVGGVSLGDKDNTLASVLLDVSQTHTQNSSDELGAHVLESLGEVTDIHLKHVEHAGFMVLKSPDIPSILVELGFISHAIGEEKLRSHTHQQTLAEAVLQGIKNYCAKRTLPLIAPTKSTVIAEN